MILFLERDTSDTSPFPEISTGNYVLPRGVAAVGGAPVAMHLPKNFMFFVRDGVPDVPGLTDWMRGIGYILVSEKLRSVLDQFHCEVEFVPVDVMYNEDIHEGYFLANPLRRIRGIDMAMSLIELDEMDIALGADKLVLEESRFDGIPISVVHETLHIAVQEEVARAIQEAGCTGCVFVEPTSVTF